jgi:hypothetical protein
MLGRKGDQRKKVNYGAGPIQTGSIQWGSLKKGLSIRVVPYGTKMAGPLNPCPTLVIGCGLPQKALTSNKITFCR